jgi:hypothetical protein
LFLPKKGKEDEKENNVHSPDRNCSGRVSGSLAGGLGGNESPSIPDVHVGGKNGKNWVFVTLPLLRVR